ncbi:apoptosis-resistant E3 ubiquitin protein ligase 1 [Spea bombifrons]|uniref:apoptosis-resistant E3 ubiquitin protein ligase 1 n=1 Tax=Spea bombifrons TaxID=233779 RepID=UPI00234A5299|nr:apoptosis-resistant E3 ubiquitin protein ligase 1 [Spea bombifrons]
MLYVIGAVTGFMCVFLITIKFLCELSSRVLTFWHHEGRERGPERTIYNYVRGKYLEPRACHVSWDWKEPCEVGQSMAFRIHLFYRNGHPFPLGSTVTLRVRITHTEFTLEVPVTLEILPDPPRNVVKASFTVRRSGRYQISISIGGLGVGLSPYYKVFQPGVIVPAKTQILSHFSTLVLTCGEQHTLQIAPCDQYSNPTSDGLRDPESYTLTLSELGVVGMADGCSQISLCNGRQNRVLLHLTLHQTGCFQAALRYHGQLISNGHFNIIVLSDGEKAAVDDNVSRSGVGVFFEGYLYPTSSPTSLPAHQRPSSPSQSDESALSSNAPALERVKKPKKVYFYISPKQLSVKEFYLRIIPWRLFTFRVCPGTKFLYLPPDPLHGLLSLQVDDGLQPPIAISCRDRNIMAATFIRFLHLNIGGSETFQDKVLFFQRELRLLHCKKNRGKITLRVNRNSLLESSFRATRNFSASDWSKNFEVIFQDEEALDWGGPRREWFELVCKALFDTNNQLFTRFCDTNQGLVHPNPCRPPGVRVKLYEFAGRLVGKCLFESSLGGGYQQLVRARFTRSFLAQIIGLRMHYKYFETDEPEYFQSKVLYLLSHDVSDTDLVFAEEKYGRGGHLEKVVELIPGGSQVPVTNENKIYYLNLLAQHRLCNQVREEVEHFLKGLTELVPENLLSIFDENELELLMCGTGHIAVQDFQAHAVVIGGSWHFREKVMNWFWAVVSSLTQEELARLLQFTTGSSQLPPGGFSALCPSFQIIGSPAHGTLPTAHTCFNQLCLPSYDSYDEMHKMLKLAISEGCEGFGMI